MSIGDPYGTFCAVAQADCDRGSRFASLLQACTGLNAVQLVGGPYRQFEPMRTEDSSELAGLQTITMIDGNMLKALVGHGERTIMLQVEDPGVGGSTEFGEFVRRVVTAQVDLVHKMMEYIDSFECGYETFHR